MKKVFLKLTSAILALGLTIVSPSACFAAEGDVAFAAEETMTAEPGAEDAVYDICRAAPKTAGSKKIRLNKKSLILCKKESRRLKLKGAKAGKVIWRSSDKKIASVKKGFVKAKKKGTCIITAIYRGKKYKCHLTVLSKCNYLPPCDDVVYFPDGQIQILE